MKKVSVMTIAILGSIFFACDKEETEPTPESAISKYAMLKVGNQWVYSMTLYEEDSTTVKQEYYNDTVRIVAHEFVDGRWMYKVTNSIPGGDAHWYVKGKNLMEYNEEDKEEKIIFSMDKTGQVLQRDTLTNFLARAYYMTNVGKTYEQFPGIPTREFTTEINMLTDDLPKQRFAYDVFGKNVGLLMKITHYSHRPQNELRWVLIDYDLK